MALYDVYIGCQACTFVCTFVCLYTVLCVLDCVGIPTLYRLQCSLKSNEFMNELFSTLRLTYLPRVDRRA